MNANDVLRNNLQMADFVLNRLLEDLSDEELFARTSPAANHVAWQLGHLVASERRLVEAVCPGKSPELPAGFEQAHQKETAGTQSHDGFRTKDDYLELYRRQREATLTAIDAVSESDLDKPSPEALRKFFPTVGAVLALTAMHQMWHIGQITAVRRHLGKPVVI